MIHVKYRHVLGTCWKKKLICNSRNPHVLWTEFIPCTTLLSSDCFSFLSLGLLVLDMTRTETRGTFQVQQGCTLLNSLRGIKFSLNDSRSEQEFSGSWLWTEVTKPCLTLSLTAELFLPPTPKSLNVDNIKWKLKLTVWSREVCGKHIRMPRFDSS